MAAWTGQKVGDLQGLLGSPEPRKVNRHPGPFSAIPGRSLPTMRPSACIARSAFDRRSEDVELTLAAVCRRTRDSVKCRPIAEPVEPGREQLPCYIAAVRKFAQLNTQRLLVAVPRRTPRWVREVASRFPEPAARRLRGCVHDLDTMSRQRQQLALGGTRTDTEKLQFHASHRRPIKHPADPLKVKELDRTIPRFCKLSTLGARDFLVGYKRKTLAAQQVPASDRNLRSAAANPRRPRGKIDRNRPRLSSPCCTPVPTAVRTPSGRAGLTSSKPAEYRICAASRSDLPELSVHSVNRCCVSPRRGASIRHHLPSRPGPRRT